MSDLLERAYKEITDIVFKIYGCNSFGEIEYLPLNEKLMFEVEQTLQNIRVTDQQTGLDFLDLFVFRYMEPFYDIILDPDSEKYFLLHEGFEEFI